MNTEEPVLITLAEAAQILRVSKGTVQNLIRRGALRTNEIPAGQKGKLLRSDVMRLLPLATDLIAKDTAIAALTREMEQTKQQLQKETAHLKGKLADAILQRDAEVGKFHNIGSTAAMLARMERIMLLKHDISPHRDSSQSERNTNVLKMFLRGYSIESISNTYSLTYERVKQILEKERRYLRDIEKTFIAAKDAIEYQKKVKKDVDRLEARINELQQKIEKDNPKTTEAPLNVLAISLSTLNFSVRTKNAIKYYNCEHEDDGKKLVTLGDLSRMTLTDLMRIRNIGGKSATEIKAALSKYGLSLKSNDTKQQ